MTTPGKRAFWMHQAAEYLIGAAFFASGLQSPEPAVPTLLGALIMLNTASSKGPLSAFRLFGKQLHRVLDVALIALTFVAAAQPVIEIDRGTRMIMALLAFCMGMIWLQSDFKESPTRASTSGRRSAAAPSAVFTAGAPLDTNATSSGIGPSSARPAARVVSAPDGSTADTIGRTAGRLAGRGVKMYRARRAAAAAQATTVAADTTSERSA